MTHAHINRHLSVVGTGVENTEVDWRDVMEREAARQRLRADAAEAMVADLQARAKRLLALTQELLNEVSSPTTPARGPGDVW